MTSGYFDQSLIKNSSLSCFILANFVKTYQVDVNDLICPSFEKMLLVLPLIWHGPSRRSIFRRQFDTPMHAVVAEQPRIIEGLAKRVASYATITAQGINLACATGLLEARVVGSGTEFSFLPSKWPKGSSPVEQINKEMEGAILRLANWFKDLTEVELFLLLGLI